MQLKQIIAVVITIAVVVIFGVVYFVDFNKSYFSKVSIDIEPPITLASGAIGIRPYFEPGQAPGNIVGFRYNFRVNQNQSSSMKIIFGWKRLYNPQTGKQFFSLETNLFNHWIKYSDNEFNYIWPPQGEKFYGQGGLWPSVSDYSSAYPERGLLGVKQADEKTKQMFPRQNSGVDAIDGFTKIEAIAQMDITGKDISVEYLRGEIFTGPLDDWGYRFGASDGLPSGRVYRKWIAKIVIDGIPYQLYFALPEDGAKYFAPWEINSFVTEFFDQPGFFQAYFWDLEIQREGVSAWEPIKKWRMGYKSDSGENIGYGSKLSTYKERPVIEISNDRTDTYYKVGDIFELPVSILLPSPSATLSASLNPCSVSQNQTTCLSVISWQTANAPDACIFVKETKQMFACAMSGNQSATDITEQGSTFEVHLTNDIDSQLLASVLVKGQSQTIVQYSLDVSKSGTGNGAITASGLNCGSDCQETYNQGTSVALTATPDSSSVFKQWQGDCSGTSPTCALTINSNKTAAAVFEIKVTPLPPEPTSQSVCSTGSLQACIDSLSPNPVKQGQNITFTGSGKAGDPGKTITKYRWRLDSVTGQTRLCKAEESTVCQADTTALSPGIHTVYFRVGTPKLAGLLTEWSNWIGRQFTVEETANFSSSITSLPTIPPPPPPTSNTPAAPSSVKVVKNSSPTGYLVTWQDNSNNETLFSVERKTENGNWYYRAYVRANATKYIDTATNTNMNTFRVRACNKNVCSDYVESNSIDLYP